MAEKDFPYRVVDVSNKKLLYASREIEDANAAMMGCVQAEAMGILAEILFLLDNDKEFRLKVAYYLMSEYGRNELNIPKRPHAVIKKFDNDHDHLGRAGGCTGEIHLPEVRDRILALFRNQYIVK